MNKNTTFSCLNKNVEKPKTALTDSIENGHFEIAKLLLQSGKKLFNKEEKDVRAILKFTIENGFEEHAKEIIKHIKMTTRFDDGKSYFIWACENNIFKLIELLFSNYSSELLEERDYKRMTGLMYACTNGNLEAVKFLLENNF